MFDLLFPARRRARLRAEPFPAELAALMDQRVPMLHHLSAEDRRELEGHVAVFLADKHFEGAGGQVITDEIKVTVAAQACLLLLHREVDEPYPSLDTVLVYPRGWATHAHRVQDRLVHEGREARSGESWQRGLVILSWDAAKHGAREEHDGHNVVLHEFAHQLDTETGGGADGAPVLPDRGMYTAWSRVLGREYEALVAAIHRDRPTTLDPYGATSPAEFFAVATEAFFERPRPLRARHPELYEQLAAFYKQDPASWSA
ncbi:MAG: zinc-dependent peptidase [Pseudomonadota bacterium]|nr:zinc-dependent peptidase [Pseudomonadota bacterium]